MTFDRWVELITLCIAVGGGVCASLMVILKLFIADLRRVANSMSETTKKIERLFDSQNSLREDFIKSQSEHSILDERISHVEDDVRELQNK